MDYDNATDFEINKAVVETLGFCLISNNQAGSSSVVRYKTGSGTMTKYLAVDYCNSWADIGPIIEDHKIDLMHLPKCKKWVADSFCSVFSYMDPNPRRTAAVVFLKMQGASND